MNWVTWLMRILQVIPPVVIGIEQIHKGAPGATKKDLAMQSLGLATGAAQAVAPEHAAVIDATAETVSGLIDGVVSVFNSARVAGFRPAADAPPPVPQQLRTPDAGATPIAVASSVAAVPEVAQSSPDAPAPVDALAADRARRRN